MRVVTEIPTEQFKITVYAWNGKYIVKFERGNYEQTYKVSEMDLTGEGDILKLVEDEAFLQVVSERFNDMSKTFRQTLEKF
jgi:hypothetical protein